MALLAVALPVFSIRLGSSDESNTPTTEMTRRAYDLKVEGFGAGASGPLVLAAAIGGQQDLPVLTRLTDALQTCRGWRPSARPGPAHPAGDGAIIQVTPATSGQDKATVDLIRTIRTLVIPLATQGSDVQCMWEG